MQITKQVNILSDQMHAVSLDRFACGVLDLRSSADTTRRTSYFIARNHQLVRKRICRASVQAIAGSATLQHRMSKRSKAPAFYINELTDDSSTLSDDDFVEPFCGAVYRALQARAILDQSGAHDALDAALSLTPVNAEQEVERGMHAGEGTHGYSIYTEKPE